MLNILHRNSASVVPEMDAVSTTVLAVWFTITMLMHSIICCDDYTKESAEMECKETRGIE